jgi:hypothetical protein
MGSSLDCNNVLRGAYIVIAFDYQREGAVTIE